jgi:hypothetical protein
MPTSVGLSYDRIRPTIAQNLVQIAAITLTASASSEQARLAPKPDVVRHDGIARMALPTTT